MHTREPRFIQQAGIYYANIWEQNHSIVDVDLTLPLAFIYVSPPLAANIKFVFEQNSKIHNSHSYHIEDERIGRLFKKETIVTHLLGLSMPGPHEICCYGGINLLHLLLVPSMNSLVACMRLKCKRPMKEHWPFLIGSCLDKKQVSLACEGARPSSQLSRHSWKPLVRKKGLNWCGLNMNGFKLSTW